jgi:hypothetical protein
VLAASSELSEGHEIAAANMPQRLADRLWNTCTRVPDRGLHIASTGLIRFHVDSERTCIYRWICAADS